MKLNILRNFLYLNDQLLDNFLSTLGDELFEESTVVEKNERSSEGGGEVNLQLAKGGGKRSSISGKETTKKVNINYAGKFQRLYEKLNEMEGIQYFEGMTGEKWNQIERNSILECLVKISFSKLENIVDVIEKIAPFAQIVQQFSSDKVLDSKTLEAINGIKGLGELNRKNGIPCICSFIDGPKYKIICYLDPELLKVDKGQLIGELNLFCKVQRKIADGEKIDLSDLISTIGKLNLNRGQKRKQKTSYKLPDELNDNLKGPALIVTPIAIYN